VGYLHGEWGKRLKRTICISWDWGVKVWLLTVIHGNWQCSLAAGGGRGGGGFSRGATGSILRRGVRRPFNGYAYWATPLAFFNTIFDWGLCIAGTGRHTAVHVASWALSFTPQGGLRTDNTRAVLRPLHGLVTNAPGTSQADAVG
jgi:hypothetical protein